MSYVLLLNYKHLSPDYKETRCSVSQPHFRNLALYLKRCLKKGSQNKPAEGESAYLAQRRQNRLFLFFSRVLLPFHLLPSGGICLRYSLPKGKSFFPESSSLHPVPSCSCMVFTSPKMQAVSFPSSLHTLKLQFQNYLPGGDQTAGQAEDRL